VLEVATLIVFHVAVKFYGHGRILNHGRWITLRDSRSPLVHENGEGNTVTLAYLEDCLILYVDTHKILYREVLGNDCALQGSDLVYLELGYHCWVLGFLFLVTLDTVDEVIAQVLRIVKLCLVGQIVLDSPEQLKFETFDLVIARSLITVDTNSYSVTRTNIWTADGDFVLAGTLLVAKVASNMFVLLVGDGWELIWLGCAVKWYFHPAGFNKVLALG